MVLHRSISLEPEHQNTSSDTSQLGRDTEFDLTLLYLCDVFQRLIQEDIF